MTWDPSELPYYNPQVEDRVAVVTGGNSGIGWFTVLHLYMHGFRVYVCGRNSHKVSRAMDDIIEEAVRRHNLYLKGLHDQKPTRYLGSLQYLHTDLTDLKCVDRAAAKILRMENHLDVLVNNAGVMAVPYEITKDGFEIQMQTNYIAHFLLTMRLLPLLRCSHGRVVTLSSLGHHIIFKYSKLDETWNYFPNFVFTWFRYAMTKVASIQYTKMLAIKNPDILFVSVHPGLVMNTNLFSFWTRLPLVGIFFWLLFQVVGFMFGVSNEQGAYSTLRCSLSQELTTTNDNGKYFTTGGKESRSSYVANNLDDAASTWIWTMKQLRNRGFDI